MTFLLDTNVVCEPTAKHPEPRVLAWLERHADACALSCVTLGEIWKGIHLLPKGKRKTALMDWAAGIERDFADVILPLDGTILKHWGKLCASHEAAGHNLGVLDSLLTATALCHDLTIVTRNTADFPAEVRTLNPWRGA